VENLAESGPLATVQVPPTNTQKKREKWWWNRM